MSRRAAMTVPPTLHIANFLLLLRFHLHPVLSPAVLAQGSANQNGGAAKGRKG